MVQSHIKDQVIKGAFINGHAVVHVVEEELDFTPFYKKISGVKMTTQNAGLYNFFAVMKGVQGAYHRFIYHNYFSAPEILRSVKSHPDGYIGLPTTAIKNGFRIPSFDMELNSVNNAVGLLFIPSENTKILYVSPHDLRSKVVQNEAGKYMVSIRKKPFFDALEEKQLGKLKETQFVNPYSESNYHFIYDGSHQSVKILDQFWKEIADMGTQEYFKKAKECAGQEWNEALLVTSLSEVKAVFITTNRKEDLLKACALAGLINELTKDPLIPGSGNVLPVMSYVKGNLKDVNLEKDMEIKKFFAKSLSTISKQEPENKIALEYFAEKYLECMKLQIHR